jgi:pimeloyl-ACP methyl ester carboxylesterase
MKIIDNKSLIGTSGREFGFDLYLPDHDLNQELRSCIIFVHGFKGFKEWGHWHNIAEEFSKMGFAFLKFNFSHNGVSVDNPIEFIDLEAFGCNNFSIELEDTQTVLNWLLENADLYKIDQSKISIIGHSRGGPIAILTAERESRISSVITWAAVHELDYAWQDVEKLEQWKLNGVIYSSNARTGQEMPLYYQIYEDFIKHQDLFCIKTALSRLNKPLLIIHGTKDPAVSTSSAEYLKKYAKNAQLNWIDGADHVFGGKHPFPENQELPEHSQELVKNCLQFLKQYY